MELNYDWKTFQSLFYSKRKLSSQDSNPDGPLFLVLDDTVIVAAFSEGEDRSDWIGATYDEVAAEFPHRDLVLYDRAKLDQCLESVIQRPHFYDQIQQLWMDTKPQVLT